MRVSVCVGSCPCPCVCVCIYSVSVYVCACYMYVHPQVKNASVATLTGPRVDVEKTSLTIARGPKLIAAFGSTSKQGGSAAKTLAATGFNVRFITRFLE